MTEDELQKALGALGEGASPRLPGDARRERILDAMQQAARPETRRWRRVAVAASAAAAVALLAAGLRWRAPAVQGGPAVGEARSFAGEVIRVHGGRVQPLNASDPRLDLGDRLSTMADGRAAVRLNGVAFASLAPMAEIAVEAEGCEVRAGTTHFEVDPLPAGKRFVVHTHDVTIEVHGTAFRVSVAQGQPTRVVVSEGVVSVTPRSGETGARLLAGEQWPTQAIASASTSMMQMAPAGQASPGASVAAAQAPQAPAAQAQPRASVGPRTAPSAVAPSTTAEPVSASDLAEQNRLLIAAASARSRGDTAAERAALETYLRRYPAGPFAAEARSLLARRAP